MAVERQSFLFIKSDTSEDRRIDPESDQSLIFAKGLSQRQKSWMLAFVFRVNTSTRLMLQKPKKGEQFTEDGNSAAEWSAPDWPTAWDEFIESREL
jgi:hypothetical protein